MKVTSERLPLAPTWVLVLAGVLSAAALVFGFFRPDVLSREEALANVSFCWSVYLLAKNRPLGWWVGLIGIVAFAVLFYRVRLYGELGLQGFYFVTSLQAIWLWLRGTTPGVEREVARASLPWLSAGGLFLVLGTWGLTAQLIAWEGVAPFWDALSTCLCLVAHVYLMFRLVESWYLWVLVDTIYVPLYFSRELYLTSAVYVVIWILAWQGLLGFERLWREGRERQRAERAT